MQLSIAFLIDLIVFIVIVAVSVAITCWLWGYSRYKFAWGSAIITGIVAAIVWVVITRLLPFGRYTLAIAVIALFVVIYLSLRHFWAKFSDVGTGILGTVVCVVIVIVIWLIISTIIAALGVIAGYLPPLIILAT
ncbi:MAG: hypothetical protein ACFFCD_08065 [Promethearchaeota archaeon]